MGMVGARVRAKVRVRFRFNSHAYLTSSEDRFGIHSGCPIVTTELL